MFKINGTLPPPIQAYKSKPVVMPAADQTKVWGKDKIEVSQDAQSFSEALKAAKAELARPTDSARMETISRESEEGAYTIDSKEIAKSILVDVEI